MSIDLKESCKQILQRLQQQDVEEFMCLLCGQRVRGQDALMQHLISEHQVHCIHFDNVVDLPQMLDHLQHLLHSGADNTHWTCPVCVEDSGSSDVAALVQHMREHGHNSWNPHTIPSLAALCVSAADEAAAAVTVERAAGVAARPSPAAAAPTADDDDDAAWDAMEDEEVDEDEDWNLNCVCLYCDYEGEDILDHLKSVHSFDFRATVQKRADVKNEYDLIRLVNMVRRAVGSDRCPYGNDCLVDGKSNDRAALEAHLMAEPMHRLPACVSSSDADLIPVLPGDAFISMLVTSGEGFLQAEDADPDFPMVPTVHELAAAAHAKTGR